MKCLKETAKNKKCGIKTPTTTNGENGKEKHHTRENFIQ